MVIFRDKNHVVYHDMSWQIMKWLHLIQWGLSPNFEKNMFFSSVLQTSECYLKGDMPWLESFGLSMHLATLHILKELLCTYYNTWYHSVVGSKCFNPYFSRSWHKLAFSILLPPQISSHRIIPCPSVHAVRCTLSQRINYSKWNSNFNPYSTWNSNLSLVFNLEFQFQWG